MEAEARREAERVRAEHGQRYRGIVDSAILATRDPSVARSLRRIREAIYHRPPTRREMSLASAVIRPQPGPAAKKSRQVPQCIYCGAEYSPVASCLAGFTACSSCEKLISATFENMRMRELDIDMGDEDLVPMSRGMLCLEEDRLDDIEI